MKAFNHIYAAQMTTESTPRNTPNRRVLVIAGDDTAAKQQVTAIWRQRSAIATCARAVRTERDCSFDVQNLRYARRDSGES